MMAISVFFSLSNLSLDSSLIGAYKAAGARARAISTTEREPQEVSAKWLALQSRHHCVKLPLPRKVGYLE